jgi:hypothetical protein
MTGKMILYQNLQKFVLSVKGRIRIQEVIDPSGLKFGTRDHAMQGEYVFAQWND